MNDMKRGFAYTFPVERIAGGMTIRETMAMHICAAMNANPRVWEESVEEVAGLAVSQADALLAELAKPQEVK